MFLRKKLLSNMSRMRGLFVALTVLVVAQPVATVAVELTKEQQQMVRYLQQIVRQSSGQSNDVLASIAVGPLACVQGKQSIAGLNEQNELQIDALVRAIDKTETSLGRHALKQSICPTTDIEVIRKRQQQVQALLDDPKLFNQVKRELKRIKKAEGAILKYWDDAQQTNMGSLFVRSGSLYYGVLSRIFGDTINQNKLSLELSHGVEVSFIVLKLIALIGLEGVKVEFVQCYFGGKEKFELGKSLMRGFRGAFNVINPRKTYLSDDYEASRKNHNIWMQMLQGGSIRDTFNAFYGSFNQKSSFSLGDRGRGYGKWFREKKLCCIGNLFDEDGDLDLSVQAHDNLNTGCKVFRGGVAAGLTAGVIGWRIKSLYEDMKATGQKILSFTKTIKELHVHTVHMARAMDAMQKLARLVRKHSVFSESCMAKHMMETIDTPSTDLEKLLDVLKKDTFTLKKAKSQFYSRGNVLIAHRMFGKVKDEVTPLLQAIGELDAVYSMACNIKEHKGSMREFAFVEFTSDVESTIDVDEAWLPIVNQSVPNTIALGGAKNPNKVVVTGPNGGGKSVWLKQIGWIVILAQSWGIVSAKRARMSLFDGVRTCIHPQESIEHELSTFMAEKLRIDAIKHYVFQNDKPGFKALLLLDEPFKGTVDSESADRIYEFGKEIAPLKGLIVGIATHVEKPIKLAQDTGAYANYHVRIKELEGGRFEREFKLEPGILEWWFNDAPKRSRFIDFVTLEKHKEQLEQQAQKA